MRKVAMTMEEASAAITTNATIPPSNVTNGIFSPPIIPAGGDVSFLKRRAIVTDNEEEDDELVDPGVMSDDSDEDLPLSKLASRPLSSKNAIVKGAMAKVPLSSASNAQNGTAALGRKSSRTIGSPKANYRPTSDMSESEDDDDEDVPLIQLAKKQASRTQPPKPSPEIAAKRKASLEKPASKAPKSASSAVSKPPIKPIKSRAPISESKRQKLDLPPQKITTETSKLTKTTMKKTLKRSVEEESGYDSDNWWQSQEQRQEDDSIKWETLHHAGVLFPPDYVAHGIPLKYDGKVIPLPPAVEEVATFFAAVIGTQYAENPTFCKNFFADFRDKVLKGTPLYSVLTIFDKCDFSPITEHLIAQKELKKNRSKEEKQREKAEKEVILEKYGFCLLDGQKEKVGNFRVEPPGLFRGRGDHPKTGCLKLRVHPEQITLNLSKDAPVPEAPAGRKWGKIVHDQRVTWLASWTENIQGDTKYVFLAAGSKWKGQSDLKKFEKAKELSKIVGKIRLVNDDELKSTDVAVRQRATALWLIDRLALRAGNEKGEEEADTVGCCSLRVEHVSLVSPCTIIFDFLGKDSIRYFNEVEVPEIIFRNLKTFMASPKKPSDSIFDTLTTSSLNAYLNKLLPGLTAKVFRTYNASFTFEVELKNTPEGGSVAEKILAYNRANRQVAVLCNHQRSIPKTHAVSMEKLEEKINMLKYERQLCRQELKRRLTRKQLESRTDNLQLDYESDMDEELVKKKAADALAAHQEKIAKAQEKMANSQDGKKPSVPSLLTPDVLKTWSEDKLEKRFADLFGKITNLKLQRTDRDENKQTALGTSKINYIDPRISVIWCRQHEVPLEKIFNKSLLEKFKWAMEVPVNWRFFEE